MRLPNRIRLSRLHEKNARRDDYISSSLTSSTAILSRISSWKDSDDPGRLLEMQFHKEWQHEDCPVMIWYTQQQQFEVRFRSIEHRKNVLGPFFHEFLLLKLVDGSVCRVERLGDGSRLDAVRLVGCTARDLIQRFTPQDYHEFSIAHPSNLIAQIDLGREFDILDVLAIGYSIQNTEACRVYTLQRYNCYFLCWTVLSILTRRLAGWETRITSEAWDRSVGIELDRLASLSVEELKGHLLLRVMALLDPETPQPASFVLEELRRQLDSSTSTPSNLNQTLAATLWLGSIELVFYHGLDGAMNITVNNLWAGDSFCMSQIKRIRELDPESKAKMMADHQFFAQEFHRELLNQVSRFYTKITQVHSSLLAMVAVERPVPTVKFRACKLACALAALIFGMVPLKISMKLLGGLDVDAFDPFSWRTFSLKILMMKGVYLFGPMVMLGGLAPDNAHTSLSDLAQDICWTKYSSLFTADLINKLEARGVLGSPEMLLILGATNSIKMRFQKCLASLAVSVLTSPFLLTLQGQQSNLRVHSVSENLPGTVNEIRTVAQFQEHYIQPLIQAHADRVAAHQLAAAPLVCDAIKNTMTEVWRSMPPGFGASIAMKPYAPYPRKPTAPVLRGYDD